MEYKVYRSLLNDKPDDFLISHLVYLENELGLDLTQESIADVEVMIQATLDTIASRKL